MKRVLTILAILLLPLSVWAMTPVTDNDLSNVTGQAGVSINQDVLMNIHMDTMAWGDVDGLGNVGVGNGTSLGSTGLNPWTTVSAGGYIGINNFNMTLRVKARTTDLYGGYNPTTYPGLRPLTIDVATTATNQDPNLYGTGVTFVRIGLGAMEIDVSAMSFDVALGAHTATPTLNQVLGTVSMGAIGIFISPYSYVDIYNGARGTGSGVSFGIHMQIDEFIMNYISWGDKDGFTNIDTADAGTYIGQTYFTWTGAAGASAGYIGLNNLTVTGPILITGTVNIDVGTVKSGYYAAATSHLTGGAAKTLPMVHITFGNMSSIGTGIGGSVLTGNALGPNQAYGIGFSVSVPKITANIALGDNAQLALNNSNLPTSANVLGDIYISGFKFDIIKGSWVDIFAH